jgi:hypothetical protein
VTDPHQTARHGFTERIKAITLAPATRPRPPQRNRVHTTVTDEPQRLLSRIGAALPDERFGDIPSVPIRRPVSGGGLSSSPNLERPAAAVGTIAFVFLRPRAARSRWREAVGQTRRLARSCTKSTTARFWRGSNQSSKAVDRREAALHDLGLETAGARLWLFYKAISGPCAVSGGHRGRSGHSPPRLSMARAIRASGVRNP